MNRERDYLSVILFREHNCINIPDSHGPLLCYQKSEFTNEYRPINMMQLHISAFVCSCFDRIDVSMTQMISKL